VLRRKNAASEKKKKKKGTYAEDNIRQLISATKTHHNRKKGGRGKVPAAEEGGDERQSGQIPEFEKNSADQKRTEGPCKGGDGEAEKKVSVRARALNLYSGTQGKKNQHCTGKKQAGGGFWRCIKGKPLFAPTKL